VSTAVIHTSRPAGAKTEMPVSFLIRYLPSHVLLETWPLPVATVNIQLEKTILALLAGRKPTQGQDLSWGSDGWLVLYHQVWRAARVVTETSNLTTLVGPAPTVMRYDDFVGLLGLFRYSFGYPSHLHVLLSHDQGKESRCFALASESHCSSPRRLKTLGSKDDGMFQRIHRVRSTKDFGQR
jgi:hypothetical protein